MLYKDRIFFETLKWDDIFVSSDDFFAKVVSIGSVVTEADMKELYELLALKYVGAHTRYTDEFSFIMALKRELYIFYPLFIQQRTLLNDMMALDIADIMKSSQQLRNLVNNPTDPVANADTVPINNLTTEQENILVTQNELEAIRQKYSSISKNYLSQIYKAVDQLFTVVLAEENIFLYPQEV